MKALRKTLLVVVIAVAGQLSAQPAPTSAPLVPPASAPPEPTSARPTAAQMETAVNLLNQQVPADLNRMRFLQGVARKSNDSFKLDCVNEQYLKGEAAANRFDGAVRGWSTSVESGAKLRAFQNATQEGATVHQARLTAERCVGKDELSGDTIVMGPQIPDDPTQGGTEVGAPGSGNSGDAEPPNTTSPFN